MKDIQLMQQQYAHMIVTQGVNLYKGQSIMIKTSAAAYPFASKIAEEAYKAGAKHAEIRIDNLHLLATRLNTQEDSSLEYIPPFFVEENEVLVKEGWAYVKIDNTDERDALSSVDSHKLAIYSKALNKVGKKARVARMANIVPWCVVCVPSDNWAKSILGENSTEDDLWKFLAPILHLDQQDPSQALKAHNELINRRSSLLTDLHIRSLHCKSALTDVTIGLSEYHKWEGGGDDTTQGRPFYPNIPTEEVFTTPHYKMVNGHITTTKPVTLLESRVEGMTFTFKEGKVIEASAKVGNDVLQQYLAIDKGSSYMGEIAIVDQRSPIAQANTIFNSILYDENASCHFALGAGYPSCLTLENKNGGEKELLAAGCNQSSVHTDFMFGSADMNIVATDKDGKEISIMENGQFTPSFE